MNIAYLLLIISMVFSGIQAQENLSQDINFEDDLDIQLEEDLASQCAAFEAKKAAEQATTNINKIAEDIKAQKKATEGTPTQTTTVETESE